MAESQNLITFTDKNFETEALQAKGPVLVDFWAEWCPPCVRLGPTIAAIADELAGKVRVGKLNVDDFPALAARYQVMSIPTVIVFRDGKVDKTLVGLQPKSSYLGALA